MNHKSPNILLLSIIDPAVDRGGAGTVTRALIRLLQQEPLNARVECIHPKSVFQSLHRVRQLRSVAKSLVSSWPSKAAFTYSRRMLRAAKRLVEEQQFDLILLNGSDLLWLMRELPPAIPRVLFAHNIEHRLFLSQVSSLHSRLRPLRGIMLRDWKRLRKYELSGMQRIENAMFLSSRDADFAQRRFPHMNQLLVPPLFEYQPVERSRTRTAGGRTEIGFLANFGWWPNRDGLHWFLKRVFPYTGEDTRLHLFGEQSHKAASSHPRIVKHGFFADVREIWPLCDFMVCPIFSGGGAKIKLAEAVYNGVPVLASSFAARGLPLDPDDTGIVLLDRAEEWIDFLRSPAAREFGSRKVSAHAAQTFALQSHLPPVQRFICKVITGPLGTW